jgi:hypothetical protein
LIALPASIIFDVFDFGFVCVFYISIFTYMLWNHTRAIAFGNGQLGILFTTISVASVSLILAMVLLHWLHKGEATIYLLSLPASWIVASLAIKLTKAGKKPLFSIRYLKVLPSIEFRSLFKFDSLHLNSTVNYLVSLVPSSFGLILASQFIGDENRLATYIGIVLITRAGLLIVNTATPRFMLEHSRGARANRVNASLSVLHVSILLFSSLPAILLFELFGNSILQAFLGYGLHLGSLEIALVVLGECALAATAGTRVNLVSIGRTRGMVFPWILAMAIGFPLAYLIGDVAGLAIAAITQAALVILLQAHSLHRNEK